MAGHTRDIGEAAVPKERARQLWKHTSVRRHVHPALRSSLAEMAPGLERCMYCGDSQGTDIDHFEPVRINPLRTFDWTNHLLACSLCNSHLKRDLFPLADNGMPLLIDPSSEDPTVHLHLSLAAGTYIDLTDRGAMTIKVFGLNRQILIRGRRHAYRITPPLLGEWRIAREKGDVEEAEAWAECIWQQPTADVVQAMFHQAAAQGAQDIFADEPGTLALLRDPVIRTGLLRTG
ncbi:HNH endonuclease [Streptomyces sp. MNU89]|uniref:HNH endonuclease n=1 Tax=Streptomyces sp. MNU89 TaxID=2560025 RepID=UPI001E5749F8|nr:HNH endonuclease [Streptomyces sp. MNU89]MCC9738672.1 HNH endonuclease [Streptomyces sp. MNU89]